MVKVIKKAVKVQESSQVRLEDPAGVQVLEKTQDMSQQPGYVTTLFEVEAVDATREFNEGRATPLATFRRLLEACGEETRGVLEKAGLCEEHGRRLASFCDLDDRDDLGWAAVTATSAYKGRPIVAWAKGPKDKAFDDLVIEVILFLEHATPAAARLCKAERAERRRRYPWHTIPGDYSKARKTLSQVEAQAEEGATASGAAATELAVALMAQRRPWGARPTRLGRRSSLETTSRARAAFELEESRRWTAKLWAELEDWDAPLVRQAESGVVPATMAGLVGGKFRPRSIRQRLKYWQQFGSWAAIVHGLEWPTSAAPFLQYLEVRAEGECGRSVPRQLHLGYIFMERAGLFENKVAMSEVIERAVDALELRLGAGAKSTRKALEYPLMVIVALELFVVSDAPEYLRYFAGCLLVMTFASLRFDDTLGIMPSTFLWLRRGLQFEIQRTKVTGVGKKVGWLRGYVAQCCGLTDRAGSVGWMTVWRKISESNSYSFELDFLIMLPEAGFHGPRRTLATYPEVMALQARVLGELRRPVFVDSAWVASGDPLLPGILAGIFSLHSMRRTLNNLAAVVGVGKADREYLGKWSADGSDNYLTTAREIVFGIQEKVSGFLATALDDFDETEVLSRIANELANKGMPKHLAAAAADTLVLPKGAGAFAREVLGVFSEGLNPSLPPAEYGGMVEEDLDVSDVEEAEVEVEEEGVKKFFISYTGRKQNFLRLHRTGGHLRPGVDVKAFTYVDEVKEGDVDAFCKRCFQGRSSGSADVVPSSPASVDSEDELASSEED